MVSLGDAMLLSTLYHLQWCDLAASLDGQHPATDFCPSKSCPGTKSGCPSTPCAACNDQYSTRILEKFSLVQGLFPFFKLGVPIGRVPKRVLILVKLGYQIRGKLHNKAVVNEELDNAINCQPPLPLPSVII